MNTNSRYTVALHILTAMANRCNALLTSDFIAASVCTNPVVIRRVLGELRRAGIVESHAGNRGGWRLLYTPDKITLCQVYDAIQNGLPFALHPQEPNANCCIGKHIKAALTDVFVSAESAMKEYLAEVTIADILRCVEDRGRRAILEDALE